MPKKIKRKSLKYERPAILVEREATHGDFDQTAFVSQQIKAVMRPENKYTPANYSNRQAEVIDMIAVKLSRIASGQADHLDHWVDIIGYCQLAVEELELIRLAGIDCDEE